MEVLDLSSNSRPDLRVRTVRGDRGTSATGRALGAVFCAGLAVVGCSIPQEGSVQSIDPVDIPYDLNVTTTSTSLSPSAPPSTNNSSDGDAAPTVESVNLFFIAGSQVVPITQLLLSPATPGQVLASLVEGLPPGDVAAGLRTAIPDAATFEITVERGMARIDLPPALTSAIPGSEQRLAIAQIVLTLTRRAGIGQVMFTSGDRPQSVPRGRGDLTQPGGSVACEDYANLLPAGFAC